MAIRFKYVKSKSNLTNAVKWSKALHEKLPKEVQESMRAKSSVREMQEDVTSVIMREIYEVYSPRWYSRTYETRDSFIAEPDDSGDGSIRVLAELSNESTNIAGTSPHTISYATYFETPDQLKSFISPSSGLDVIRYRPFFRPLKHAVLERLQIQHKRSIEMALNRVRR